MTRDEIRAVYDQGPDAVIDLVERLFAIIADQQAQIAALTQRVRLLEERLAVNSRNSNKPPSSDNFSKKSRSLRKRGKNKSGAQKGHAPHNLRRVDSPDEVVLHKVDRCKQCNHSLEDVELLDYSARQVFDLPAIKLSVTEHRAEIKPCPQCGTSNLAAFPQPVSNTVQYGENIKAFAVYLMSYQLLPYRRTREILEDLTGQGLAEGTLQKGLEACYEQLEQPVELIKQAVEQARVGHFDETGFYLDSKRQWLHVAATNELTYYQHHKQRGRKATDEIGILPVFRGRAMHDGLRSYLSYECAHALCNVHHLRELTFLEEEQGRAWAGEMKRLLNLKRDLLNVMPGAIVIEQVALEMMSWVRLVEQSSSYSKSQFYKLHAAEKIRLLLHSLNVPTQVPAVLGNLVTVSNQKGWSTGPQALTAIRNSITHSSLEKRDQFRKLPIDAVYEAWKLGLWYIELVLLSLEKRAAA